MRRLARLLSALVIAPVSLSAPALAQTRPAEAAVAAAPSAASAPAGPFAIPTSRPTAPGPGDVVPEPKRFITRHTTTIAGQRISYTAIAGETHLFNRAAEPIGSIFSFTYLKDGPADPRRPVLFVFNGGPGSSSLWLHMGVVGPRRVVLDQEVNPANVPPFGVANNPHSLIDVADLVFIDPVGTGWSKVIGRGVTADFWGVDEDADAVAQFIELWLSEHGRWNAPKFVMGESYGSIRAAVLPRALMGGPLYVGVMRGVTLNGIILLGATLDARPGQGRGVDAELRQALQLPALADTAWHHRKIDRRGRSLEVFHEEALAFAKGPYLEGLRRDRDGELSDGPREGLAARLSELTGLPAQAWTENLRLSDQEFSRRLLLGEGVQVGIYDSRYTLPLHGSGGDPVGDDPAMGRYVPGFVSAFHQMVSRDLKVQMNRPYGAIVWKDLLPSWNWSRTGVPPGQGFAVDLAVAMRRNPSLQVLVASGYFDLATHAAPAEQALQEAGLPSDRLMVRRYPSGHMLYLGDTAEAFANDVRELIARASR